MMAAPTLEEAGGVARLVLPGGLLDERAAEHLADLLADLAEDDAARVVVVSSTGSDFCLGVDAPPDDPLDWLGDPAGRLAALAAPVLVAVRGRCQAEGLALVLGADLVVAHPAAGFAIPEVPAGRLPRLGVVTRLVRSVGRPLATAMVLAGDDVTGERALRHGLVHELHPDPDGRVADLADELMARAPLALELAKDVVRRGEELSLAHALRLEGDANHLLQASADRAEGLAAFFERRSPRFGGR